MDLSVGLLITGLYLAGGFSLAEVIIMLLLFITTTEFVRPDYPHGTGMSMRKPGGVLASISLLSFVVWLNLGGEAGMLIATVAGALVFMTSRFAVQAITAVYLSLGVFVEPLAVIVLLLSFALSALLSKGDTICIYRDHLGFVHLFAVKKQYEMLHDGFKSIDTARKIVKARTGMELFDAVFRSITLRGIIDNLFAFTAMVGIVLSIQTGTPLSLPVGFIVWFLTTVAVFFITSVYHLRFLGQAERYLEYSVIPGAAITARAYMSFSEFYQAVVWASIGLGLIIICCYLWLHRRWIDPEQEAHFDELVSFLAATDDLSILVQPRSIGTELSWRVRCTTNDPTGIGFSAAVRDKVKTMFPYSVFGVTDDIEWLEDEYDFDYVVFDKSSDSEGLEPPETTPLLENNWYEVYNFKSLTDSTDWLETTH
jgi:hypothetical protein